MKKKGCLTCAYRGKWEGFMPCKNWNRRAVFYCNKYGCSHAAIKTKCKDWKNSETPVKKYHWVFVTMTVCALPDLRRNAIVNFIRAYGTKQTLFAGGSILKTDDILTSYEKFCDKVYEDRDECEKALKKQKKNLLQINTTCSIETVDGFDSEEEAEAALQDAIRPFRAVKQ